MSRRFLKRNGGFLLSRSLCATSTHTKEAMSTTTQNITTKKTTRCTPAPSARWSAEKTRTKLAQSFSKLGTQSGPTPWAEVELTEE